MGFVSRAVASSILALFVVACDDKKPAPPSVASSAGPAQPATTAPASVAALATLPSFDPAVHTTPFAPLPEAVARPVLDDAVKLGQMLYFDVRLSRGHDVSCASCHDLARSGIDAETVSTGTKKRKGKRNTPTVLNAGGSFAQGWDARSTTIEDFIAPHVNDPAVMGMDDQRVVDTLASIPAYAAAFKKAFPDENPTISSDTLGRAMGAYTKKLFTRSRWDKFLAGDKASMNDAELGGLAMFVEAGCITCHQGKYLGANQVQKLGIAKPWPSPGKDDPGRFEVTKQEGDRGMFKIPTLRNVAKTAPYLHDGSIATLEETTRLMSRHQIGRELSDAQIKAIVTFLGALEGDPPKELVTKPQLPPSGPKTPPPAASE
jgi:cytochrome c peroxidase